jgi:signal transduction histidine kinase
VRAKNIYDVESEIVSFSFVIKAPIYRTGWAYLIYLMLFALFVIFIVKFYTNNLLQQKNLLEQKVEERTQEIQQKNEEILVQRDDILQINAILEQQKEEVTTQAEKLQEANQVKNQLFSIISHDLRSPLNQLVATLQIFQAGDFSEKELQKILPELSDSVQNTLSLTDNLLFWARDQMEGIQMMPQSFKVLPIIEENIQLFRPVATRKGIELKSNIEENFNVYADKEMIKLVFRNLINNAIKFCNSEDLITLEAKITPQNQLEIAIIDTGVGIEAEKIPPLFSSQSTSTRGTSNEKGIGLGLILCKDFLEKNEGSIRVESVYTKGSIFYITLPLAS